MSDRKGGTNSVSSSSVSTAASSSSSSANSHPQWSTHSLIPAAFTIRESDSKATSSAATHGVKAGADKQIRLTGLTAGFSYPMMPLSKEEESALDPQLLEHRRDLAAAMQLLSTTPSVVPTPVTPSASSVLAFAAASVPMGSHIDPLPLGSQLIFPAARPTSRQQVSYLFFALEAMLKEVGRDTEIQRAQAIATLANQSKGKKPVSKPSAALIPLSSADSIAIPSLMTDLQSYATWLGLASSPSSALTDLTTAAFTHKPSSNPQSDSVTGSNPSSTTPSTFTSIDARFQTNVEVLQKLASDSATSERDKSHQTLVTVLQELSVYLIGMHEIARQEYFHCQERGDLLHILIQRCAVLAQSMLPIAQKEVIATVAEFKGQIHSLLMQQETKFQYERHEFAKLNTRTSSALISIKGELKQANARVQELEAELERRRLECAEVDRLQRINHELTEQLDALRQQVDASAKWRIDQQLTAEKLHYDNKQLQIEKKELQEQMDKCVKQAEEDQVAAEKQLLSLQTRFLELRIPDEMDPTVKAQIDAMIKERAEQAKLIDTDSSVKPKAASAPAIDGTMAGSPSSPRSRSTSNSTAQSDDIDSLPKSPKLDLTEIVRPASLITPTGGTSNLTDNDSTVHEDETDHGGAQSPLPSDSDVEVEEEKSESAAAAAPPTSSTLSLPTAASHHRTGSSSSTSSQNSLPSLVLSSAATASLAAMSKNTRLEFSDSEVELYLLTNEARFYDMVITRKQREKFQSLQLSNQHTKKKLRIKLPGQIGPRDWLVNFCWASLKRKTELDAVADCYQQSRQSFPEFFYQMLLLHETVNGVKSVFNSVIWSVIRSLVKYKNTSYIVNLILDLLEESISLDGLNFLMAMMSAVAHAPVGVDYGAAKYGQIRWVCTLRTRYVNRLLLSDYPESVGRGLNDEINSHAEGMSLAEIKQHQATVMYHSTMDRAKQRTSPHLQGAQDVKQLTKIDYGLYLRLAAKHFNKCAKQQILNVKHQFNQIVEKQAKKSLSLSQFGEFLHQLIPSIDSRSVHSLYTAAVQHARGDGIRFDDFKSAGGLQLLEKDHARLIYQTSDWGSIHGEREVLSCVEQCWGRFKPTLKPLRELATIDRSLLSQVLSERLTRLETHVEALRLSLIQQRNSRRIRELLKAFRETMYEVYAFLRYREEYGAVVKVKNEAEIPNKSPLAPDRALPTSLYSPTPGPNLAHLNDEINAMLFMIQRELLSFVQMEEVPVNELIQESTVTQ